MAARRGGGLLALVLVGLLVLLAPETGAAFCSGAPIRSARHSTTLLALPTWAGAGGGAGPSSPPPPPPPPPRRAQSTKRLIKGGQESGWTTSKFSNDDESRMNDAEIMSDSDSLGEQPGAFRSGFVSIIGNPNVGKSTLMNAMLGQELSIVSPKPQTTRHRILGVLTNTTYQLVFSDTPGMLDPAYMLQETMMESVRTAAGDADVVCLVSDVYGELLADTKVLQKLLVTKRPVVVIINKVDLAPGVTEQTRGGWGSARNDSRHSLDVQPGDGAAVMGPRRRLLLRNGPRGPKVDVSVGDTEFTASRDATQISRDERPQPLSVQQLTSLWAQRLPRAIVVCISAQKKWGVDDLVALLVSMAPLGPKYFPSDAVTNRDERFFASEIIREALFFCYQDEVPYSCEVTIDAFKDKSRAASTGDDDTAALTVIEATVIASRESQKAILIGKGGSKLKELGTAARTRLELFLGRRVFLSLRVKVDEDWRANAEALERYGYVGEDFG